MSLPRHTHTQSVSAEHYRSACSLSLPACTSPLRMTWVRRTCAIYKRAGVRLGVRRRELWLLRKDWSCLCLSSLVTRWNETIVGTYSDILAPVVSQWYDPALLVSHRISPSVLSYQDPRGAPLLLPAHPPLPGPLEGLKHQRLVFRFVCLLFVGWLSGLFLCR